MARNRRQYGTGQLLQRGKSWFIRWYETEMMQDGSTRRVQRHETLGPITRKQAADILTKRVATSGSKPVLRASITFAELASQWKASVVPMYKHSTAKIHVAVLEKHLLPRFGKTDVSKITKQEIQAYVAQLKTRYSPKTVDHYHDVLSAILRTAAEWGYISENPARGVILPKLKTVRPRFALTKEQVSLLLSHLPPLARTMVALDVFTGIRRGEIFALRWENVDWKGRAINIVEAVYDGNFGSPKTDAGVRTVPLCDFAFELLWEWRKSAQWIESKDLVFCTANGKPICPNNVLRRQIFPVCDELGLPRATWLTFRRTYASLAHDSGIPAKVIAKIMGHTNIDVTLNIYTQVLDGSLRMAADKIGTDFQLSTIKHKDQSGEALVN